MPIDCPHCSKSVDGWVPEDRLKKATADKREALASAAAAATQLEELTGQAAGAADLQAALEQAQAELAQVTASHTSQISVMGHGITDPDDIADLLAIFGRRAPEGVTVGDWLADTANLPRAVSALMSTPEPAPAAPATAAVPAPAAEAAPAPVANGTPLPAANTGAVPTPPAQALPSAADLANMTTEQYRANRDRILAGLTKTPTPA
jgi:hypothetical protein